jgi:hypothetical protein
MPTQRKIVRVRVDQFGRSEILPAAGPFGQLLDVGQLVTILSADGFGREMAEVIAKGDALETGLGESATYALVTVQLKVGNC